jgi:serine/threonine-protein kinase
MASRDETLEDTSVVYERLLREQETPPPPGGADAYDIVEPIGRGGMGEVWKAVQRSLGREVALKQLATDNPAAVEHFLSEARVTARLSHANIIPVHTLGRAGDGRPMLAMKLVKGTSWHDLLHGPGATRDLSRHLSIFLSVCNAVAFAHAEGFLHRDLKPANVMVADYGQVFVLDWGLAVGLDRATCEKSGILHAADVRTPAGTPAYMAPELASGDGAAQGPATDVYLLGACLHEVVTGRAPHGAANTAAALVRAVESPPPEYGDDVPRELADICRKAMARAPGDRYPDVPSLRAAVEAFVAHSAARAVTEKGLAALGRLTELSAAYGAAPPAEKLERARAIHRTYTEARFAFEHALESWPDDPDARAGLASAAAAMLGHALEAEDLALATRLVSEVEGADLRGRVDELRRKVEAREAELLHLREHARLLDDKRVAKPLGQVFVVAGVIGGIAAIPSRLLLARGAASAAYPIAILWLTITLVTGAYAAAALGRAKKSLVSPRVGWTWAGVGVACLGAGAIAMSQGEAPFQNASYTTIMISIGFVAMAMQTRLWLLFAAATTFVGALAMGAFPSLHVEIFGALWFVTLTGVGLALRRGARFDSEEAPPSRAA